MVFCKLLVALALCACLARAQSTVQPTYYATGTGGVPNGGGMFASIENSVSSLHSAMAASVAPITTSMNQMRSAIDTEAAALGQQMHAVVAAAEAQYCTPAAFKPSQKKPATFNGHAMKVTFSLGSCMFNETTWIVEGNKELNCTEPSITYTKTPANFTSMYHTAPKFTSQECQVNKTFGESVEKVLFVFDGSQAPDMNSLVTKIAQEVQNVMGTMTTGASDMMSAAKAAAGNLWR